MNRPLTNKYQDFICDSTEPRGNRFYRKYIKVWIDYHHIVEKRKGFFLHMGNGDIDREEFPVPQCLINVIEKSLRRQYFDYNHSLGDSLVRILIAEYENFIAGKRLYSKNNVGIVLSSTGGFSSIIEILMRHYKFQGHCLIALPTFPVYEAVVWKRFGIKKVAGKKQNAFLPTVKDIESAISEETRFIILTSPSFPFGKIYSGEDLSDIIKLSNRTRTYIILDEIFYDLPFGPIPNIGAVDLRQDYIIRIKAFSKDRSVPGLRIGYVLANEAVINELNRFADHYYGCPPTVFEAFIAEDIILRMLLKGGPDVNPKLIKDNEKLFDLIGNYHMDLPEYRKNIVWTLAKFKENRDRVIAEIKNIPRMEAIGPDAGINMGIRIEHRGSTFNFFKELFFNTGVIIAPGEVFDMPADTGSWYRLTFANNLSKMLKGLLKIKDYLRDD